MSVFQNLVGMMSPTSSPSKSPGKYPHVNVSSRKVRNPSLDDVDSPVRLDENEKDKVIQQLQNELIMKEAMIEALDSRVARMEDERPHDSLHNGPSIVKRHHPLSTVTHVVQNEGKISRSKVSTRGSILTANILEAMPDVSKTETQHLAEKFIDVFQNPVEYIGYLQSPEFGSDLMKVCVALEEQLEAESRCLFLQSPVSVNDSYNYIYR